MSLARILKSLLVLSLAFAFLPVVPAGAIVADLTVHVVDGYGVPLVGASVTMTGDGVDHTPQVADASGNVYFSVAQTGADLLVTATKDGYFDTTELTSYEGTPVTFEMRVPGRCMIRGTLLDPDGAPAQGVDVELSYDGWLPDDAIAVATTDANGFFIMNPAPAIPSTVWFTDPSERFASGQYAGYGAIGLGSDAETVTPIAGNTVMLGTITLEPTTFLDMRVFDPDRIFAGGGTMVAWKYDTDSSAWERAMWWMGQWPAGSSGNWGLPAGDYRFEYNYSKWNPSLSMEEWFSVYATTAGPSVTSVGSASTFSVDTDAPTAVQFGIPAGAPLEVVQTSIAGTDRFDTAVRASKQAFPDGATDVVIATGRNWPDALGGSTLAGALYGPILLVEPNAVPESIADEIERLGAENAHIVGGTAAVSAAVETELTKMLGAGHVVRIAGANRYETANKVAVKAAAIPVPGDPMGTTGTLASGATAGSAPVTPKIGGAPRSTVSPAADGSQAIIATGANFPDALAASPMAALMHIPVFLAGPNGLSAETLQAMDDCMVEGAVILGGESAISAATETSLETKYGDDQVTRISGADRYETAVAIAGWGTDMGLTWNDCGIATGTNFPDALAGGVTQGLGYSVMLLTKPNELSAEVQAALAEHKYEIGSVRYFGGTSVVGQSVRDAVTSVLQ